VASGTVVCVGRNSLDHYYRCVNKLRIGEKILLESIGSYYGGMIPNAASILSSLGLNVFLFDTLGKDTVSEEFKKDLQLHGVETVHIHDDLSYIIPENTIILNEREGIFQSTIFIMDKPRIPYTVSEVEAHCMTTSDIIYTTTKDLASVVNFDVHSFLREYPVRLVLDVEDIELRITDQDRRFLLDADIIIFNKSGYDTVRNEYEAGFFTMLLSSKPDKLIIHTQGSNGCSVYYHGSVAMVDGIQVTTLDPTGAGDAFNAVLIACLLDGDSPEEAAIKANKAAAESTTAVGPRAYLGLMHKNSSHRAIVN